MAVTIGISPCVIWEIKRELFMYIITYLCTHGLWVDSRNGNEGKKEWKKKWNGNEIGKKGHIVKFCLVTYDLTIPSIG